MRPTKMESLLYKYLKNQITPGILVHKKSASARALVAGASHQGRRADKAGGPG
jgi:hypothetical protein